MEMEGKTLCQIIWRCEYDPKVSASCHYNLYRYNNLYLSIYLSLSRWVDQSYDDGEFYQQLLREFISRSSGVAGNTGMSGSKRRKAVDRRASKGRKVRYVLCMCYVNVPA